MMLLRMIVASFAACMTNTVGIVLLFRLRVSMLKTVLLFGICLIAVVPVAAIPVIGPFIQPLIFIVPICICLKGTAGQKIFTLLFGTTIAFLYGNIACCIAYFVFPNNNDLYNLLFAGLLFLFSAIYFILLVRYGKNFSRKLFQYTENRIWYFYSLGPMIIYAALWWVRQKTDLYQTMVAINIPSILLLTFISAWGLLVLCVSILRTHEKTASDFSLQFASEVIAAGQEYYTQLANALERTRILRHDYKHHIAVLDVLLEQGKDGDAKKHLQQLTEAYEQEEAISYCSNPVIDALIIHYTHEMKRSGIKFSFQGSLLRELAVSNYELCIIVGNLLENAVDACRRLPDSEGKTIELKMRHVENQLVLKMENAFDGMVLQNEDGLASMKLGGGLGTRSVQAVAEKYRGSFDTEWTDSMFTSYVLLNLP